MNPTNPTPPPVWIAETPEGYVLKIFVQPRSSKNMIVGSHGDALKIKLTAPPVDNAANKMCVQYLSKYLSIAKSSMEILSGKTSRTKQILIRKSADNKDLKEKISKLTRLMS